MKMAFHLSFWILKSLLVLVTLHTLEFTKGCVENERLALLDFKKSFHHNDGKLSSWNSSEEARNCCTWEGITCDNHTWHVISLDLLARSLQSHQLRPSLLELQHLRKLDLSFNNLAMRIPNFIGSLRKLTFLDTSYTGFFGMVPPHLGNLSSLQTLSLGSTNLSTDNFQWLSHLSSLESLEIRSMNFSEARDWLTVIRELPVLSSFECDWCYLPTPDSSHHHVNSTSSLQRLDFIGSYLSSSALSLLLNSTSNLSTFIFEGTELDFPFPDIFHDMISLKEIYVTDIHLEAGIFNSIGNLCNLDFLKADGCVIKESLPDIIQALSGCASTSLKDIEIQSSNLSGTIPPMLKFPTLIYLGLTDNNLDSIPPLNTLPLFPTSLAILRLDDNNLNGLLSDLHFTNLSNLQELTLANNPNLTIHLNKPLTGAHHVDLSFCNLGPNFPTWLLSQNSIVYLEISHSKLFDAIPILFWTNLSPNLTYLDLSSNSLYGVVPNIPLEFSYSDLYIDLSSNALTGQIPFFLFMAIELHLSNNHFSGFLSHVHNKSASLQIKDHYRPSIVDISNNLLSGLIPHWLGFQMPNLGALILTNNNLSGTIPSSIGSILYVLSLRNNSFSGPLPFFLKNCSTLSILDLGANRFSGFIPSWMGEDMKNLVVLSLGFNNFSGILPTNLCRLSSLQILDVSHNTLSGNIPTCIQDFNAMARVVNSSEKIPYLKYDVTDRELLEDVPYFNAYIKWKNRVWQFQSILKLLRLIDLSSNNLSGEIPVGLISLVELDSLDLSCNNLQGSIPEEIGQLKSLQYLNLSSNRLSGQIPASLSEISALEMLGLAHNNLSGRIPSGTQLRGFDPSAYSGNPYLCGMPLNKCPGDRDDSVQQPLQPSPLHDSEMENKWPDEESFFAGLGTGFAFGFLEIRFLPLCVSAWRMDPFGCSVELLRILKKASAQIGKCSCHPSCYASCLQL